MSRRRVRVPSQRAAQQWLSPSQVVAYGEAVRAQLRAEPTLTVNELTRRTGAPSELVARVARRWREAARP